MRAVVQHELGGPERLELTEVADPLPANGEVRIVVAAAGVHLIDTVVRRTGRGGPLGPVQLPMIPGREVAGVVDMVGDRRNEPLIGAHVVAGLGARSGGYAELALADATSVHVVPDLPASVAVAMVGTGRTAVAILQLADPRPGEVAVVSAAAGGVGALLVQALTAENVHVVALAGGPRKVSLVESLGAPVAIDCHAADWPGRARAALGELRVSLALDGVGGTLGREVLELLDVGGRLVMYGTASGAQTPLSGEDLYGRGITVSAAIGARLLARPERLPELETRALELATGGALTPVVDTFRLQDAATAHRALEARTTVGKVVLVP